MVFGMEQDEEGALNPVGLVALTDKTDTLNALGNYVPETLMR